MVTASISEAKAKLSGLLEHVRAGETVTITDRGVPVAQLTPLPSGGEADRDARLERLERAGLITRPKGPPLDVEAFLAEPRPRPRRSVLDALLEERREGDR